MTDRGYLAVWAVLMLLLGASVGLSRLDLGAFAVAAALAVAAVKAALVMACFMRLKDEERLLWLVAGSGFVWLAVLVVAILDELNSRSWLPP